MVPWIKKRKKNYVSEKVGPKPVRLGLGDTAKNRIVLLSREVEAIFDPWPCVGGRGGGGQNIILFCVNPDIHPQRWYYSKLYGF